jgi:hypothetical protein
MKQIVWTTQLSHKSIEIKIVIYNIVTCYLATRQVICGFRILYLDLLDKSSGGITINYYTLNLIVNTLR